MIEKKNLELLQFDQILERVQQHCYSKQAKALVLGISATSDYQGARLTLEQTRELKNHLLGEGYFPSIEHEDIQTELNLLGLQGAFLSGEQLHRVKKTSEVANTLLRFVKGKPAQMPFLYDLVKALPSAEEITVKIGNVIDEEAQVKNTASAELAQIRKDIAEKRRESDKRFYNYIQSLRKLNILRENEEGFFNGRRTLALMIEHKSEVSGFVHSKSESGKTIFIEPSVTVNINNELAELEIDEQREVNRILRELCGFIYPFVGGLKQANTCLIQFDFLRAKAKFAEELKAGLPNINFGFELKLVEAYHPLLYLQNKKQTKTTVPLSLDLNQQDRLLVISGPNAGGKTIALKTVGLLQLMLQSGFLIPVGEGSSLPFFEKILIDIGDTQSIENELSTYSAKLVSMTHILTACNDATLVLMDEFGSGTDPELGSAIAEAVLESLVLSKTKGIITSHFGNVKILAGKLNGAINGSMLFDSEHLEPKYTLSVGEPGSSYTFEVAERIGFPMHLIERAKGKVDREKLKLNRLLAEVQDQKTKLKAQVEKKEHETFLQTIAKEKYQTLFNTWEEKINNERERKIELSRLADYGKKYLRLMDDWNFKKDRKLVIKRFIDGITAESKKQEELKKQNKKDIYAEKKIARIKPAVKIGSKVKVLNSSEVGVVEGIKDERVQIKFGTLKMTVGMENIVLVEN